MELGERGFFYRKRNGLRPLGGADEPLLNTLGHRQPTLNLECSENIAIGHLSFKLLNSFGINVFVMSRFFVSRTFDATI